MSDPTKPSSTYRRATTLSRRRALHAILGAGSAGLLAACGAAPAAPAATALPAAQAPTAAVAAAQTPSGTLRLAHVLEWAGKETLTPAAPNRFFPPISLLYSRLVREDAQNRPVPDLAVSWEPDESATRWTFKLREGITFHDGRPFTAKDVVYTMRFVVDPELESPGASVLTIVDTEQIETPDDQTVIFNLTQPHADFPLLLLHYACYIIPEGSGETIGTTGIGTGAFKLQEFAPEGKTVVVANEDYYAGPPKLASIEIVGIADSESRAAALLADQIDYDDIGFEFVEQIRRNQNYVVQEIAGGDWLTLVMRVSEPPFDDERVRMALKLVVDREAMVQQVLQGYGQPAYDHPVWPGDPYYLKIERERDIERARALLAEAGYPDGLDVTLYTSDSLLGMVSLAVAYKEQAEPAGIRVEIQQVSADGYWNDYWLIVPFCVSSWSQRQADQVLNEIFRTGAEWNETNWSNAEFEALLDAARRELDQEERKALYHQAQQLLADQGGSVIPVFSNYTRAFHKRVQGIPEGVYNYDYAQISVQAG
jgi:peptide/nickel transport system substrate-binding protein